MSIAEDRGGLKVRGVKRNSPAARKGLREGDRILAANGQDLQSREALGRETLRAVERGSLLLVVQRGRYAYHLNFPL